MNISTNFFQLFSFKSCFRASGDTPYARSEYPLDFCYGADTDMKTGYAICLPQPCEDDATQVMNNFLSVLG